MITNPACGIARTLAVGLVIAGVSGWPAGAGDFRQELTASYNEFGQQLFAQLRSVSANGNIVLSPYSIGTATAMVLAGARGDTEREIVSALRLKQATADVPAANAAVMAILNGYDRAEIAPTCPDRMSYADGLCVASPTVTGQCPPRSAPQRGRCVASLSWPQSARLLTANALMLGRETRLIAQNYVALLRDNFSAEVFRNVGLFEINSWVHRRTEGRILNFLEKLDPNVPAVILNTVYFRAAWQTPFGGNATAPADFNLSTARKVPVPTMRLRSGFAMYAGRGFRALRLPYTIPELSMTIVLPNDIDGLAMIAQRFTGQELSDLFAALRMATPQPVAVALPQFKSSFRTRLGETFQRLGIKKAFDIKQADLSGMTSRSPAEAPLAIQDVIHQTVINVTETGTEAAAATAIIMMTATPQPKPEEFTVDRPFLFFITDDVTGAILFEGRILDPRG